MFVCSRCGNGWKARTESPKVCPRCKSKKWKEEKSRAWEKEGRIYVVLTHEYIKVGRSLYPKNRIRSFVGKVAYYISNVSKDMPQDEKRLKDEARSICGAPIAGEEYFKPGGEEYKKIVAFIDSMGLVKGKTNRELKDVEEIDTARIKMSSLTTYNIAVTKIKEAIYSERKEFFITIKEMVDRYKDNEGALPKDLENLLYVTCDMMLAAKKDLEEYGIQESLEELRERQEN